MANMQKNVIIKTWLIYIIIFTSGILNKKKGLIARTRMFLLTDGTQTSESGIQRMPHLYYVDPAQVM